jgi:ElaB/YqjD/DUF883 family membrane-anchored ribosome-binding protein
MNTQYRRPTGTSASNSVSDMASAAQDKMSDTMEQAQEFAQDQYDKLTTSIRRNPLQAAGIAAGVGFVLALLARR